MDKDCLSEGEGAGAGAGGGGGGGGGGGCVAANLKTQPFNLILICLIIHPMFNKTF